jgi:trk system potassium uptake protein TrkA
MFIVVVGCGRVGAELAHRLYKSGHQVSVVDVTASAFNNLSADFRGRLVEGEALNQETLHRAGIEQADGVAVVTNSDSLNAVIAHIAKQIYHVPNIAVRNYDPANRDLFEAFNLQVVTSSSWGAQRLEEILYAGNVHTIFSAGNGEVEIYEIPILENWDDHPLHELIPPECAIAALTRAGRALLPTPETRLKSGDVLLVSATLTGIADLRRRLGRVKEV